MNRKIAEIGALIAAALLFAPRAPAQVPAPVTATGEERRGSRTMGAVAVTTLSTFASVYTAGRMLDYWGDSDDFAEAAWVAAGDTAGVDYALVRGLSRDAYEAWERGNMWRNYFLGSAVAFAVSGYLLYRSLDAGGGPAAGGGAEGASDVGGDEGAGSRWEPIVMVTAPGRGGRLLAGLKVRF